MCGYPSVAVTSDLFFTMNKFQIIIILFFSANSNEKAEPAAKKSLPEKAEKLKKKPRHEIRHDRNKMPIKQPQKISAVTKTSAVAKKPHYNKISKVKKTAKLVKK